MPKRLIDVVNLYSISKVKMATLDEITKEKQRLIHCRRCRETGPVVETVHVYHRARRRLQVRNHCNEHATAATDHEIGGAHTEAIKLDERPILGRDLK